MMPDAPAISQPAPVTLRPMPSAAKLLRFIKAVRDSRRSPTYHMAEFKKLAAEQIGGPWWKENQIIGTRTADRLRPYSPLGEMVRTYFPHLVGKSITPTVEPSGLGNRGEAKMLEYRMRQWADDSDFRRTDERVVMDAILAAGFYYVYRNVGGQAVADDTGTLDMGQPGVAWVGAESMVVDPYADDWDRGVGQGHYFEVDRQLLLAHGIGDPDLLRRIPNAWESNSENRQSPKRENGSKNEDEYLDDKILLYEFCFHYLGRRFCCTLPPVDGPDEFVVEPYEIVDEPDGSRYVPCILSSLPGHLAPISPAMVMMDAHLAKAAAAAKLVQQIQETERKYAARPGNQDAVMRLMKPGGDSVVFCDPESVKEFIRGGMVKELAEGFAFLEAIGTKIGPNIELAGGQSDPGESATASSILAGNAAVVMGWWKEEIERARTKVLRRVAAMLLQGNDRRTYEMPVGNGRSVPLIWDAATMDVSYDQFRYRLRTSTPDSGMDQRQRLLNLRDLLATLPAMLQVVVGMGGDPQKALRVISDMAAMPELDEILPSADAMQIQMQLFQMLAQTGQARPVGVGGQPMPGGAVPAAGPETRTGQLNADLAAPTAA